MSDRSTSDPETARKVDAGSQAPDGPSGRDDKSGTDGPAVAGSAGEKKSAARGRAEKSSKRKAAAPTVKVAPVAAPARLKRRHWGVLGSFVALVVLPLLLTASYLWTMARDQYASTAGFTVRQEDSGGATELLGGVAAQLSGGAAASDAGILYEYIQSQAMVGKIEESVGLTDHYSQEWRSDPVFALWPDPTIEGLTAYWSRIVDVAFDQTSGQIELHVRAYDPETATEIAEAVLRESQLLVNDLNATARADASRFAEADLRESLERLKAAREALTLFRVRTQIVDPETDLQGRMAVVNTLQAQLAQALVDLDVLKERTNENDPRVDQERRQIEVIRERIRQERAAVAEGQTTANGESYPQLLAEYEGLVVDREFAEESYRAALTALDIARTNASRQTRYLATYINPTVPQAAEYPRRPVILGLTGLFFLLGWSILVLIYYSIRDSR